MVTFFTLRCLWMSEINLTKSCLKNLKGKQLSRFNHSQQQSTTQPLTHSLPSGMGKRIRRVKVRKPVGWDEGSLTGKQNLRVQVKQSKELIHYFPLAGKCSAFSRNGGLHHMSLLLGKTNAITLNVPPFLPLSPQLYADHDSICHGTSLWPVWVSCPRCAPSQLLVHLAGQVSMRSWKFLDCLATTKIISVLSILC